MATGGSVEVGVEFDVHGVIVRPGDTLVVAIGRPISAQSAEMLRERFELRVPGVSVVIVEAQQLVVYRPDPWTESTPADS